MSELTNYQKKPLPKGFVKFAWMVLVLGIILAACSAGLNGHEHHRTMALYHVSFMALLMAGLGSLFFVILDHLVDAHWSTPFRRVAELLSMTLPVTAIYGLPLVIGAGHYYHWAHIPEGDHILAWKEPLLNVGAFAARYVVYFVIWIGLAWFFYRNSRRQDLDGDLKWSRKSRWISGFLMLVLGFSVNFAGFDLVMSLEPHWFSALFGAHIITATMMLGTIVFTLIGTYLAKSGVLHPASQKASWMAFGGLLFALMLMSVYTAFVQVWLIWYGNVPEETLYIMARWFPAGWEVFSWILVFGHFVIPFLGMLPYVAKRNYKLIHFWAWWLLVMYFLHMVYLILGALRGEDGKALPFHLLPTDIGFALLPMGVLLVTFIQLAKKVNLVPVQDPKLKSGLHWH